MEYESKNHTSYCRGAWNDQKGTKEYVNEIPRNMSLLKIQKIVLNSTAHIIRRTLSL